MVAGNWKMNLLHEEALALARAVRDGMASRSGVDAVICPPYPFLHGVAREVSGSTVSVGAQNVHWEEKGAFTGEVSVTQVAECARYAIIGHSERRQLFGETDETVNRRVLSALAHGVTPIMCVGETLEQRQSNETEQVLIRQLRGGLQGVTISPEFVVAYEPVWAIGTGLAADAATAQAAAGLIRATLRDLAGEDADGLRILYGGSVTAENMGEFAAAPDIDGGLVGGASLKADSFLAIIDATARAQA